MPRTGDSEPRTKQRGGYLRIPAHKPQRGLPDPIDRLRTEHGDATVEVYGEATLQALDEWSDVDDIDELLTDVRPLATVDLSEFAPVKTEIDFDDRVERLKASVEPVDGEEYFEARYLDEAFDENVALLTREIDSDE